MNTVSQNKVRAIIICTLRTAALLCASGSLMQTFLSVTGFSEQHIYLHATLFQAVNVLTILLCSRFADGGSVIRRSAIVQIPGALLFLLYLPLCILRQVSAGAYVWLLLVSVMQSVTIALHTVCEYKTPYYLFHVREYGMVSSLCGILSSAASFGVGALISLLCNRFSYDRIMLAAFTVSCVLMLLAGGLQFAQKSLLPPENTQNAQDKAGKIPLLAVFRHKAFSTLLAGNLTRGFAYGTTTVLAAAALGIGYGETLTSAMVSVSSLANLAACALFAMVSQRLHPRYVILLGSLGFLVMPLLLVRDQPVLYLAAYAVLLFGRTLVDYAVPAALLYAVPVEIAGTYNAWRMILHNGGTMLATMAAGFVPLPVMLIVSLVFQIFSGISFCAARVMKQTEM